MDTHEIISEAKLRFSYNANKQYLSEKYDNKLVVAQQNGLWKADSKTISFLNSFDSENLILIDNFNNPVLVNRKELLQSLIDTYNSVMEQYYQEYKSLENKR